MVGGGTALETAAEPVGTVDEAIVEDWLRQRSREWQELLVDRHWLPPDLRRALLRNREWREILVDASGSDPVAAATASARSLAADRAEAHEVIYAGIRSFYRLDAFQMAEVISRLAEEGRLKRDDSEAVCGGDRRDQLAEPGARESLAVGAGRSS
jgi:hypothetical protein